MSLQISKNEQRPKINQTKDREQGRRQDARGGIVLGPFAAMWECIKPLDSCRLEERATCKVGPGRGKRK